MKAFYRNVLSLLLALMLCLSAFSPAMASEALIGQQTKDGYTIVSIQIAYSESGAVHLYDENGETIVATLGNGASVAVTDGRKGDQTFVQFGATSGWIENGELYDELPQTITGQISGSSAPEQAFTPIETVPPQSDDVPTSELDTPAEAVETDDFDTETIGDPKKDHPAIAAMYSDNEQYAGEVAVDVIQLGVVTSIIVVEGERKEVNTSLLTFSEELPDEQKIGYVHAPRTGQASLRENPAKDGKVITQLKAGQLAAVLAVEESYAHVNIQGVEGWLRLDCLKYLAAGEEGICSSVDLSALGLAPSKNETSETAEASGDAVNDEADASTNGETPVADTASSDGNAEVIITDNNGSIVDTRIVFPTKAVLSCKGETDGATSVNLRNLPTKDSAKAAVLRTGVEVTVLSGLEGWYLVETDGICGFVMEAFLSFAD